MTVEPLNSSQGLVDYAAMDQKYARAKAEFEPANKTALFDALSRAKITLSSSRSTAAAIVDRLKISKRKATASS